MKSNFCNFTSRLLFLVLILSSKGLLVAQDAPASSGDTEASTPVSGSTPDGSIAVPAKPITPSIAPVPVIAPMQVDAPSVTLPTPPLPSPPIPQPSPVPEATPQLQLHPVPQEPSFAPPTALSLNLPSAQAPGNSSSASTAMPNMSSSEGPGALGNYFDWAKKLRFQAALRSGYDSNVNSVHTNVVGSIFANLNGGVNYRFGDPRLVVRANLTGGVTSYPNAPYNKLQGQIGLGVNVEYRLRPRLVLTLDSSSSYQAQPNASVAGSANNASSPYIYTANSMAASYQISDLWTSVTRLSFTQNYYFQNNQNNQNNQNSQGFIQPAVSQSLRYLYKPSTTLVADYNADYYGYSSASTSSRGQSLVVGFDHIFNPKLFWNFRGGVEYRYSQNSFQGNSNYIGPSVDNNLSWAFGKTSSINWVTHVGTQPSGQQNVSYSASVRSGLNYTQGIFTRLKFNAGISYLLNNYQNNPVGLNGSNISYNQTNLQGNLDLDYQLNRIIDISLGYQYMTSYSPAVPYQEYNRGITYLQVSAGF